MFCKRQNLQRVICWFSIAWEVWSCWRSTRDVRAGVWVHLSEAGLHVQLLHLQSAQPELHLGQDWLSTWRLLPLHWSWCCAHVSEERWFSVSCCHSHHQSGGFTLLHNSNWRGTHEISGLSVPLLWTWSGRVQFYLLQFIIKTMLLGQGKLWFIFIYIKVYWRFSVFPWQKT